MRNPWPALADATVVGVGRFELPTSRSRTVRSSLTELHPAEASPYHHWRNHILADSLKGVEAQLIAGRELHAKFGEVHCSDGRSRSSSEREGCGKRRC
jgi:hypothetical protein